MTEPYGHDLWNRHEHREEGHAAQEATKQYVGMGDLNRWGNRIWKHNRLQEQSFSLILNVSFIPKAWNQSSFEIILAGAQGVEGAGKSFFMLASGRFH